MTESAPAIPFKPETLTEAHIGALCHHGLDLPLSVVEEVVAFGRTAVPDLLRLLEHAAGSGQVADEEGVAFNVTIARPALHACLLLGELGGVDELPAICLGRVSGKEVVGARENVLEAGPARAHDECRGHTVTRRHAAEDERFLDVVGVAPPGSDA